MTSMASEMSPSPLGSSAQSMPSRIATPLQAVETEEQTFTMYRSAPGAIPLWVPSALRPAAMSETWVPWPSKSIGFGSGASGGELAAPFHFSPTKSVPPLTLGAFGPKKSAQMPLGATAFCAKQVSYASTVPGPPRYSWVKSTPESSTPIFTPVPSKPWLRTGLTCR